MPNPIKCVIPALFRMFDTVGVTWRKKKQTTKNGADIWVEQNSGSKQHSVLGGLIWENISAHKDSVKKMIEFKSAV